MNENDRLMFDVARENYDDIVLMLDKMGGALEQLGDGFEKDTLLNAFDVLLQFSLIQLAAADRRLNDVELTLVRDLPKHADIVEYFNSMSSRKTSWSKLLDADIWSVEDWLRLNLTAAQILGGTFAAQFALIDSSTDEDEYAFFEKKLAFIEAAFCALGDGVIGTGEKLAATRLFIFSVLDTIDMVKTKLDEE